MATISREKLAQAVELVKVSDAAVWLTFVRETVVSGDPALSLILDGSLTWLSALMVTATGEKVAVVGNYDADPLRESGNWDRIVPYVHGIREALLGELERIVPAGGKIAVNYSSDDVHSDGLGHGMYMLLSEYLSGTRFDGCLTEATDILGPLRGVKSPSEVARMGEAIGETVRLFTEVGAYAKVGMSERRLFSWIQEQITSRKLGFAWDTSADPIVNSGPNSMIGHGIASEQINLEPGHIFHIDLGVVVDGYCSDMQRCWYVSGGEEVPNDVLEVLAAVNGAISAGANVLRPGALGHEVDAAARSFLIGCGFEEYLHAFGHQVGRTCHDGGAILGPQWERYGRTPSIPIRAGEVYTLELGVIMHDRGYLGLEEMVVVTDDGIRWLTERQKSMPVILAG